MKKILLFTCIILLIPILIVGFDNKENIINKIKYGSYNSKVIRVKRMSSGNIENVPLEKYIIGVVAGEMPADFNIEALKSQAVASRTYVLKRISKNNEYDVSDNTNNQVYIDNNQMQQKWKDNYNQNYKKIKKAVMDTKGEVVLYNNNLIDALFFSTSNGYTENSADVFTSDLPYLKSVESSWDKSESPVYYSTNQFTKNEFLYNLGLNINQNITINNINKTNTGRIKDITINNKKFKSSEIRNIFNLKSTSFSIKVENDMVIFNVNGYGHGVGLSQYGSNGMAKKGYNYKQILLHYYQNCEIKNIN